MNAICKNSHTAASSSRNILADFICHLKNGDGIHKYYKTILIKSGNSMYFSLIYTYVLFIYTFQKLGKYVTTGDITGDQLLSIKAT
jgi:hypothetical protein